MGMLADNAYTTPQYAPVALDRWVSMDSPRFVGDTPKRAKVATGLAPDLFIEVTIPTNPSIIDALLRLHALKALPANWDSYGSVPIAEAAFRPALELIIEAVQRCQPAVIVPLAHGGIGLRWEGGDHVLELDVL